jgi:N-acetylmuramic acid 6-phosphate etherase
MKTHTDHLQTETRNPRTLHLDTLDAYHLVELMNQEDAMVHLAVQAEIKHIAEAVELIHQTLQNGGRIISFGAGTSGRLAILDASECPPTFSTTDEFIALIAGGKEALIEPIEGAEDNEEAIVEALKDLHFSEKDCALGVAASGRTPFVKAGLSYARQLKAKTIALSCNKEAVISALADVAIELDVGPEVLTGSTRLKAGTATKMVLNMLSTAPMVLAGKVYENLMVDVKPTNDKLKDRAVRIVMQACKVDQTSAQTALNQTDYRVKQAIVMIKRACTVEQAQHILDQANGHIRKALQDTATR